MDNFDRKIVRKNAWGFTFKKGLEAWFLLVIVAFIFSFVGASNPERTSLLYTSDRVLGFGTQYVPRNVDVLTEYILSNPIFDKFTFLSSDAAVAFIGALSRRHTWFINALAANFAYFQRNSGEVIASLIAVSIFSLAVKIFIYSTFNVGKNRYFMENRYERKVKIGRIFAPFHRKDILHITIVMSIYRIVMYLWSLTIIGGIYMHYRYKMVPYLIAENPTLSWKEAKNESKKMTYGHKVDMFFTELSCLPMLILQTTPFLGLLVGIPFTECLGAEMYFALREEEVDRTPFIEKEFDKKTYFDGIKYGEIKYVMTDVLVPPRELRTRIKTDIKRSGSYNIYDYIFFFFSFCFIGWIWEVSLHFVQFREFVNRGTMYGPWLPIYGWGIVRIIFLLDRFKDNKYKLFALTMGVCAILEYAASWYLEFFCNSSYWDYKQMFLNVNGRICFVGLIAFGLGGQFGIYVAAPRISSFVDKLGEKKVKIISRVLITLFLIDLACCSIFGLNTGSGVGAPI